MTPQDASLNLLADLVARARRAGADAADGVLAEGVGVSHAQRLGAIEKLERAEGYDLGLRVLIGKRQAIVASNDRSSQALEELVARAVAMAKARNQNSDAKAPMKPANIDGRHCFMMLRSTCGSRSAR